MARHADTFIDRLSAVEILIIDGALATEIENRGCDIGNRLWAASILTSKPELVQEIHRDYFLAGADIAISCSYQASTRGLQEHLRCDEQEAQDLIKSSVKLAQNARRDVLQKQNVNGRRPRDLYVAGSVGPYGAYLANGAEYTGDYHLSSDEMKTFHRPRIAALVEAGVDVLAIETQPSFPEIASLCDLLQADFPHTCAWVSLTTRDPEHLSDGTPLSRVAGLLNDVPQIAAFGVNCIPETQVEETVSYLRTFTKKPLVAYPNSGEQWNAETRTWHGRKLEGDGLEQLVRKWEAAGARLIGGCCRTGPASTRTIYRALTGQAGD